MTASTRIDRPTPGSLRLVLTLAIAGLISGIAIIAIYEGTLPTITANKARELREAVFKVLPGVSRMQPLVFRDGQLVATAEPAADEGVVYVGYDDDGDRVRDLLAGVAQHLFAHQFGDDLPFGLVGDLVARVVARPLRQSADDHLQQLV